MSYFPSISQNVTIDALNTGVGITVVPYVNPADIWHYNGLGTSTLGVNAIQLTITSTKNLVVYVDQGNTNNAFQVTDTYDYLTTKQFGITVQTVSAFVRVRIKNPDSSGNATVTINTVLCPIVEALPRSLDASGHLQVSLKSSQDNYGFDAENTPNGDARSIMPIRQAGVTFEGPTLDTNFWLTTLIAGGTVTQTNGRVDMLTNTTANGVAALFSARKARHISGASNLFRMAGRFGDAGTANNVRQFGAALASNYTLTITSASLVAGDVYTDISGVQYTILITVTGVTATVFATGVPTAGARTYTRVSGTGAATLTGSAFTIASTLTDGFYFQLSGTTFSVVTSIGGTPTPVDSGSFNGDVGATYIPGTNMQVWEIYYNSTSVWFTINGVVLHKIVNNQTPLSNTLTLNAFVRNGNFGGGTTNVGMYLRSCTIKQLGPLDTERSFKYSSAATTAILKYGAGRLYKVIFGDPMLAQVVTLYDGLSASAPVIATLTNILQANQMYRAHTVVDFGCPFHNGLTMVTSTTAPVTLIYE
jgi:hypothetical protein